jgi:hypothetical protein
MKKAVQLAVVPRSDGDDVLYVLFDDGEIRKIWCEDGAWFWSTTGPSASCRDEAPAIRDRARRPLASSPVRRATAQWSLFQGRVKKE